MWLDSTQPITRILCVFVSHWLSKLEAQKRLDDMQRMSEHKKRSLKKSADLWRLISLRVVFFFLLLLLGTATWTSTGFLYPATCTLAHAVPLSATILDLQKLVNPPHTCVPKRKSLWVIELVLTKGTTREESYWKACNPPGMWECQVVFRGTRSWDVTHCHAAWLLTSLALFFLLVDISLFFQLPFAFLSFLGEGVEEGTVR